MLQILRRVHLVRDQNDIFKTQNSVLQLQLLITFLQAAILNSKYSFPVAYTNTP